MAFRQGSVSCAEPTHHIRCNTCLQSNETVLGCQTGGAPPSTTHLHRNLGFSAISLQGPRETSVCIEDSEMINAHEPVIVLDSIMSFWLKKKAGLVYQHHLPVVKGVNKPLY